MAAAFRYRPSGLAATLAIAGLSGLAGMVAAEEAALAVPPEIVGYWRPQEPLRAVGALHLYADGVSIEGREGISTCRVVGMRGQTRSRWYLDFSCEAGRTLHLDINLVSESLLLAAQRPLGEAEFFERASR